MQKIAERTTKSGLKMEMYADLQCHVRKDGKAYRTETYARLTLKENGSTVAHNVICPLPAEMKGKFPAEVTHCIKGYFKSFPLLASEAAAFEKAVAEFEAALDAGGRDEAIAQHLRAVESTKEEFAERAFFKRSVLDGDA